MEVRRHYRMRVQIEEIIRACKDQLGLGSCQARSERAQLHHISCYFVAFCVLERERHARQLSFRGRSYVLPALERLRSTA